MSEGKTIYEANGGEQGVLKLINCFYKLMNTSTEGQAIRAIHPADLSDSNQKLFEYFSGWLGGHQLFLTPCSRMLRARQG